MMDKARFYFGDIVVVDENCIGCVVKTWENTTGIHEPMGFNYEVYVRNYNQIREYPETLMQRYVVGKELSEDEEAWHGL